MGIIGKIKAIFILYCSLLGVFSGQFERVLLQDPTALCLDGSPGAYYIDRGREPLNILLYFQGGAWCGDVDLASTIQNCYQRSKTTLGSSKTYPESVVYNAGILSELETNPFKDFTRIFLRYCDGSGFQGTRTSPVVYKNTKLYFRGNNITIAMLNDIEAKEGLFSKATKILVTGGSAGGLATFVWADYIKQRASTRQVYAAPDSGIFLDSYTFDTRERAYAKVLQNIFKLSNIEISPPVADCIKQFPQEQHKCMMAEHLIQFIKTPLFVIQPLYDYYSILAILNINCFFGASIEKCSPAERQYIQHYQQNVTRVLRSVSSKARNGAWAPACVTHGFIFSWRFTSQNYRIPMRSENSVALALKNWIDGNLDKRILIDESIWPNNQPCSHLASLGL